MNGSSNLRIDGGVPTKQQTTETVDRGNDACSWKLQQRGRTLFIVEQSIYEKISIEFFEVLGNRRAHSSVNSEAGMTSASKGYAPSHGIKTPPDNMGVVDLPIVYGICIQHNSIPQFHDFRQLLPPSL